MNASGQLRKRLDALENAKIAEELSAPIDQSQFTREDRSHLYYLDHPEQVEEGARGFKTLIQRQLDAVERRPESERPPERTPEERAEFTRHLAELEERFTVERRRAEELYAAGYRCTDGWHVTRVRPSMVAIGGVTP